MKITELVRLTPRMLRADSAALYVGSAQLLSDMEKAGWIKPSVRGNRLTLFDVRVLDAACDRLGDEGYPGRLSPEPFLEGGRG